MKWSGHRGSSRTLWSKQPNEDDLHQKEATNPYDQNSYESQDQPHLKHFSLSPHLPIDIYFLKGFLIFRGKKPITVEKRGKGGGGFLMGSRLPNHDAKGWKKHTHTHTHTQKVRLH